MFDNLLGRKFSNKCKHAIKCINSRIAMIRNKKRAMVRFLKKDVADLLTNGRHDNAYGRMDALIVEINHTYCYDLIEQCCESILKQLPTLQKQRECPQEAMEPISTLTFAAARFSDLPELCDLRRLFTERYGSHMESSVKAEFVEKIQKRSFSQEKKLQLIKDIAQEFSVAWASSAFEHKMSNLSAPKSDQPKNGMHHHSASDKPSTRPPNEAKEEISSKGKHKHAPVSAWKQQVQETKDSHVDATIKDGFLHDPREKTRKVIADEPENVEPDFCSSEAPSYIKPRSSQNGTYNHDQLKDGPAHKWTENAQEALDTIGPEEQAIDAKKSSNSKAVNMAPPYTKSHEEKNSNGLIYDRLGKAEEGLEYTSLERWPVGPVNDDRLINFDPPYVKSRVDDPPSHPDQTIQDSTIAVNVGYDGSEDLKGDEKKRKPKPMPVSVRRRFTKPSVINISDSIINKEIMSETQSGRGNNAGRRGTSAYLEATDEVYNERFMDRHPGPPVHVEVGHAIDDGKLLQRTPSGQRRLGSRRRIATAYDGSGGDEDEIIMDRLLIDYSKKGLASGASKVRIRSEAPPTNHVEHEISDKIHPSRTESVHAPDRSSSLLPQLASPAAGVRRHSRAASMQPDNGGRVHPRLPNYDDLAARFNALRRDPERERESG